MSLIFCRAYAWAIKPDIDWLTDSSSCLYLYLLVLYVPIIYTADLSNSVLVSSLPILYIFVVVVAVVHIFFVLFFVLGDALKLHCLTVKTVVTQLPTRSVCVRERMNIQVNFCGVFFFQWKTKRAEHAMCQHLIAFKFTLFSTKTVGPNVNCAYRNRNLFCRTHRAVRGKL